MSLPALASVSDLATWLGISIDPGDPRAQAVLDATSGLVRSAVGLNWVDQDGALIADVPRDAVTVAITAAARAWQNPTGATGLRQGPFSGEWRDGVMLTEDERAILSLLRTDGRGGLGTISTTRGDLETSSVSSRDGFVGPPIRWDDGGYLS